MTSHESAPPILHVATSFGTVGPLQSQLRQVLDCGTSGEHSVAIAFTHAGLPCPAGDLSCRHFLVKGDLPFLAFAAATKGMCYYFAVNLSDSAARSAFSAAYGAARLEVIMSDPISGASSCTLELPDDEHPQIRAALREDRSAFSERKDWLMRLGDIAAQFPTAFGALVPEASKCTHHSALFLLGDTDAHMAAVCAALKMAPRIRN